MSFVLARIRKNVALAKAKLMVYIFEHPLYETQIRVLSKE